MPESWCGTAALLGASEPSLFPILTSPQRPSAAAPKAPQIPAFHPFPPPTSSFPPFLSPLAPAGRLFAPSSRSLAQKRPKLPARATMASPRQQGGGRRAGRREGGCGAALLLAPSPSQLFLPPRGSPCQGQGGARLSQSAGGTLRRSRCAPDPLPTDHGERRKRCGVSCGRQRRRASEPQRAGGGCQVGG